MSSQYDDMLYLPHHVSPTRKQMSMQERAAQFSPFAALTGYDAAIRETGRLTDQEILLQEDMLTQLNEQMLLLHAQLSQRVPVTVTYFRPDARKSGGAYATVTGVPKRIDQEARALIFSDGSSIPLDRICGIGDEALVREENIAFGEGCLPI